MAADVLMGNDPECGRWIRALPRVAPAEGEQGRRVNRRRGAPRRPRPPAEHERSQVSAAADRPDGAGSRSWSSSRRRAGAAGSPPGTTVLDAARSLGVDIDSVCGGRGICGRCQVEPGARRVPQAGPDLQPDHLSPAGRARGDVPPAAHGLAADRRLSCTADAPAATCVIDVPPESQVHRQVVRKEPRPAATSTSTRSSGSTTSRSCRPELASPHGDLARLFEALEREWGLADLAADLRVIRALQPALAAGDVPGDRGGPRRRAQLTAVWPGLHERGLRGRDRRRLDDDRRPPGRPVATARSSPRTA